MQGRGWDAESKLYLSLSTIDHSPLPKSTPKIPLVENRFCIWITIDDTLVEFI